MTDTPAPPDPEHADALARLLGDARWFGGKGRPFHVRDVREGASLGSAPEVSILLVEVAYDDDAPGSAAAETYQVPLALYDVPNDRLEHARVGDWAGRTAYDAVHDRDAMAHLLGGFDGGVDEPVVDAPVGPGLVFHRLPGHDLDLDTHSTLFPGEQSNSSVMFGEDAVLKVFRKVTPGENPDVSIHAALTRAGSENVAALYGWLTWSDPETTGGEPLVLGMLQQFLRTASDGWDLALISVRNLYAEADLHADEVGGDFAAEATRLGHAVAEVHRLLAEQFPTEHRSAADLAALAAAMTDRLLAAAEIAPELDDHVTSLRATYDALARLGGDDIQRVHGDLHLGQTLRTVLGWKIVDFEGEPAKPLAERLLPDSPWRDVAGMVRSFDYAPRVAAMQAGDDAGAVQRMVRAVEWSTRNQQAFLAAYAGRDLTDAEETLLRAYIADKAVYEVVYEARNRPAWIGIPLAALGMLTAAHDQEEADHG